MDRFWVLFALCLYSWLCCFQGLVSGQTDSIKYQKTIIDTDDYDWRIAQEELDGIYIPADLQEALIELEKRMEIEGKEKFKSMSEDDASRKLHFSFGRWIMKNWSLYRGSRLSQQLKEMGLYHPDDMVQFIIVTYHRLLNEKPLEIEQRIRKYQDTRKTEHEQRLLRGYLINEWKVQADTVKH